jgi:putative hemolysin
MNTGNFGFFFAKKTRSRDEETTQQEDDVILPAHRKLGSLMTRRTDIIWIDSGLKKSAILEIILAHPEFGHFPVCSGKVDSVLGVLPARSFLASLNDPAWPGIKRLVNKPVFLPETVTIKTALAALAKDECRMAFIIDEYGGVEGLVTKNGLVDELLAETSAMESSDDPDLFQRDDGSWLVGGQIRMEDIEEIFHFPDAEKGNHDYYTLAGYILSLKGSIPKTGDRIQAGAWTCEIVDMDGHRIDKVLVSPADAGKQDA